MNFDKTELKHLRKESYCLKGTQQRDVSGNLPFHYG